MQPWECEWFLPCLCLLPGQGLLWCHTNETDSCEHFLKYCLLYDWWVVFITLVVELYVCLQKLWDGSIIYSCNTTGYITFYQISRKCLINQHRIVTVSCCLLMKILRMRYEYVWNCSMRIEYDLMTNYLTFVLKSHQYI